MIEINNIKKKYGKKEVLKGVSFKVEKGDFVALVGKNGSGKSTIVDIITKLKKSDSGNVRYGFNDKDIYKEIGVQTQEAQFDERLSIKDMCALWKGIYNIDKKKINELLEVLHMDNINQSIGSLSGGQKQKLNILLALVNDPKFLILDELTTGLDAISRNEIRDYLKKIHEEYNVTVFMVSHYMDEIEELCNKMIVLKDGVVYDEGNPRELVQKNNFNNLDQYIRETLKQ